MRTDGNGDPEEAPQERSAPRTPGSQAAAPRTARDTYRLLFTRSPPRPSLRPSCQTEGCVLVTSLMIRTSGRMPRWQRHASPRLGRSRPAFFTARLLFSLSTLHKVEASHQVQPTVKRRMKPRPPEGVSDCLRTWR